MVAGPINLAADCLRGNFVVAATFVVFESIAVAVDSDRRCMDRVAVELTAVRHMDSVLAVHCSSHASVDSSLVGGEIRHAAACDAAQRATANGVEVDEMMAPAAAGAAAAVVRALPFAVDHVDTPLLALPVG